jgi:hypothetical protein
MHSCLQRDAVAAKPRWQLGSPAEHDAEGMGLGAWSLLHALSHTPCMLGYHQPMHELDPAACPQWRVLAELSTQCACDCGLRSTGPPSWRWNASRAARCRSKLGRASQRIPADERCEVSAPQ